VIAAAVTQKTHAANLVQNGSFELTSAGGGQLSFNTIATDWGTTGYNFLITPGAADTTGELGVDGYVAFWGPGNPTPLLNGLPATSPDGGNYVALDSYLAPDSGINVAALTQTINGLTVGQSYALSFYWAGAQQYGFYGPTTDQLMVSLGSQTDNTAIIDVASQGFSPWTLTTLDYTATSTSEVLSFLAAGTPPVSDPPFVFLDGVSLQESSAPDATSTALLFGCTAAGLGIAARRYNRPCRQ